MEAVMGMVASTFALANTINAKAGGGFDMS
jgi:FlaG/FlaF family flagellin (archaellin)